MSFTSLLNKTVTITTYTYTNNSYGEQEKTAASTQTVAGRLWGLTGEQTRNFDAKKIISAKNLIVGSEATISVRNEVTIDGINYAVLSVEAVDNATGLHHYECIINTID
jgi:hypothetical protein